MTDQNEQEFDILEFLGSAEFENPLEGDERAVTIRTSGGSQSIPWEEGITLEEAVNEANLVLQTRTAFYLEDNEIEMGTVLPAGSTITAIGATQKGG